MEVPRLDFEIVIQKEASDGARRVDRPMIRMYQLNPEDRINRRTQSQAVWRAQYEAASAAHVAQNRSQTLDEVPGIGDVLDDVRGEDDGGTVTYQFRMRSASAQVAYRVTAAEAGPQCFDASFIYVDPTNIGCRL